MKIIKILTLVTFTLLVNFLHTQNLNNKNISKILQSPTKMEIINIAKKYHDLSFPKIEFDFKQDYNKKITKKPIFDGNPIDTLLCKNNLLELAMSISYLNSKNYYLAFASANITYNPLNLVAVSNFATAIATYSDELINESVNNKSKQASYLNDAIKVYAYAINLTLKDGVLGSNAVEPLICLGNIYLDMNKLNEAFVIFNEAHKIDSENYSAITGIYNYYIAKKDLDNAFKFISKNAKYAPAFIRAITNIENKIPPEELEALDDSPTEETLEQEMVKIEKFPTLTTADFIEEIDQETARKIRNHVDNIQTKMRFKAPQIEYILEITSFEIMSSSKGISALEAFSKSLEVMGEQTMGGQVESMIKSQMKMLENLGIEADLGFDINNIEEMIKDAKKNPKKYENWNPKSKIKNVENIQKNAMKYAANMMKKMENAKKGNVEPMYEEIAKTQPEFKIMSLNPYDFQNPNDILLQRYNTLVYFKKKNTYQSYLRLINIKTVNTINEIITLYLQKFQPLLTSYTAKLREIEIKQENGQLDSRKAKVLKHALHLEYYGKFNYIAQPVWNQATNMASVSYKKIAKASAEMYKECMKNIMLISDEEVREEVESSFLFNLKHDIQLALNNVLTAYSFAPHYNIALCECDEEEINELKKQLEEEAHQLANEQIKKNIQAKKNFDQGVLDENSKYYKEFIKKYEYEINLIVFKAKVSPYISKWEFGGDIGPLGGVFSKETHHLRNTTTYDGGVSFGGKVAGVDLKSKFGFTATKGKDGIFRPKDIDIRAAVEAGVSVGKLNLSTGIEASAMRGTKVYGDLQYTGNSTLNKLKEVSNAKWLPGTSKSLWQGEYKNEIEQK